MLSEKADFCTSPEPWKDLLGAVPPLRYNTPAIAFGGEAYTL